MARMSISRWEWPFFGAAWLSQTVTDVCHAKWPSPRNEAPRGRWDAPWHSRTRKEVQMAVHLGAVNPPWSGAARPVLSVDLLCAVGLHLFFVCLFENTVAFMRRCARLLVMLQTAESWTRRLWLVGLFSHVGLQTWVRSRLLSSEG